MSDDTQRTLAYYRTVYGRSDHKKRHIAELQGDYRKYRAAATAAGNAEDNRILEGLFYRIQDELRKIENSFRKDCPIAFIQPSWFQAQLINSWHPDLDPDAPEGYQSLLDISSVRVGKSFGMFLSLILWMIPNDPDWLIFDEYEHPVHGKYRVHPRWDWDEWQRTGRRVHHKDIPPKSACENWLGCVDENHWLLKVTPALQKLFPTKYVKVRPDGQLAWYKSEKVIETKWDSRLIGKLYNSGMDAWSGAEMFMIACDEGPPEDKIDEAVFRTHYIHIAFTPREASNIGVKTALAKKIYKGKKALVGKLRVIQAKMKDTEDFVLGHGNAALGAKKKAQRLATAETMGEAGLAAVEGGFWESSGHVFELFDPKFNVLPVTGDTVVRAVRGELLEQEKEKWPWLARFAGANLVRGFDEGIAHPTAVVWVAILRTGEKVAYRDYESSNSSITARCENIIELSGNRREPIDLSRWIKTGNHDLATAYSREAEMDRNRERATGQSQTRYREIWEREPIRRTFADSKIFKRDPAHPMDDWTENYRRAGLTLERARNDGPAERCDKINEGFRVDKTRSHLNPLQGGEDSYGCCLYMTRDCETLRMRIEEYLWDQYKTGQRLGEPTGKPQTIGDDLIDALGYVCVSRIIWVDPGQYIHSIAHR